METSGKKVDHPILLLDGALATELEHRGAVLSDHLWSARILAEQPELIREVHLAYFQAGAQVATTASYQATLPGFAQAGYDEYRAKQLIQRSVKLAQEAKQQYLDMREKVDDQPLLIAASVGPYGAYLADGSEYKGQYGKSTKQLIEFHLPRLSYLIEAQPDIIAFETLPCLQEAEALLRLVERFPEQQAWFSFSAKSDAAISDGTAVEKVAKLLHAHPQVSAVGVNCTPPRYITGLLKRLRAHTDLPLVAYPNSGEGWDAQHRCWLPESRSPSGFGTLPQEWVNVGARWIGGCCRTRPEDIRQLGQTLKVIGL
jgi:homocysteine S-methyltransferase